MAAKTVSRGAYAPFAVVAFGIWRTTNKGSGDSLGWAPIEMRTFGTGCRDQRPTGSRGTERSPL